MEDRASTLLIALYLSCFKPVAEFDLSDKLELKRVLINEMVFEKENKKRDGIFNY